MSQQHSFGVLYSSNVSLALVMYEPILKQNIY